jgi:serine/threonine-protein kinase
MSAVEGADVVGDPLIGRVVEGRYRIQRAIGRGGMGIVYEAQHLLTGRKVALKVMAAHASWSPAAVKRFRREAQAAAAVGSSHVVDVLDMGSLDAGSLYIVLEHLNGVDLGFALATDGRFSTARTIDVVRQLCDALSAVHAAGIVHRDLKPDNVFLIVRDGKPDFVKVLDFGVCKFHDDGTHLTMSGDRVGTPQFMAPEQIEGSRELDHRTDIHALGAILFLLLTGRPPFTGDNIVNLMGQICQQPAPSIRDLNPELPSELDAVIQRALQKRPEDRFESSEALKAALSAVTNGAYPAASFTRTEPALAEESELAATSRKPSWAGSNLVRFGVPSAAVGVLVAFVWVMQLRATARSAPAQPTPGVRGDSAAHVEPKARVAPPEVKPVLAALPPTVSGALQGQSQGRVEAAPAPPKRARQAPLSEARRDTAEERGAAAASLGLDSSAPTADPASVPLTETVSANIPSAANTWSGVPVHGASSRDADAADAPRAQPPSPLNRGPKRGL